MLGKKYSNTLGSINNLIVVLNIQGKYKEVEEYSNTLKSINDLTLMLHS